MNNSVLTVRLNEKEAELIEKLKKKTGCASATRALMRSAEFVCNELPEIIAMRDEYHKQAEFWAHNCETIMHLTEQKDEIDRQIDKLIKNSKQ